LIHAIRPRAAISPTPAATRLEGSALVNKKFVIEVVEK
jgi:hypothetical protein